MWREICLFALLVTAMPLCLSLIKLKYNIKITALISIFTVLLVFALEYFVLHYFGRKIFMVTYPFHTHITVIICTLFLNEKRDASSIFAILTVIFAYYLVSNIIAFFMRIILDKNNVLGYTLYSITIPLAAIIIIIYRRFHVKILNRDRSWFIFSLIPMCYLLLYVYCNAVFFDGPNNPMCGSVFGVLFSLLTLCMYIVILTSIVRTDNYYNMELENKLLTTQVKSLTKQCNILNQSSEEVRICRHDMRHIINNVGALLENSDNENIKSYINRIGNKIEPFLIKNYSDNANVNAIISHYVDIYQRDGIEIIFEKADFPKNPKFNYDEFTIAFTNAFENAYNACKALPEGIKPYIKIECVSSPCFALRISNPVAGEVKFNNEGMPVAKSKNHGIGIISMKHFAKRNDMELFFNVKDGIFTMNLIEIKSPRYK